MSEDEMDERKPRRRVTDWVQLKGTEARHAWCDANAATLDALMAGTIPDFGEHSTFHEGVELTCRYAAPGLTLHDLIRVFSEAKAKSRPGDELSGNPSKWPDVRGVNAVLDAVLRAVYGAATLPPGSAGEG